MGKKEVTEEKKKIKKIKMGKRFEQVFVQKRYTNGQLAHEMMPSIISYRGNAN